MTPGRIKGKALTGAAARRYQEVTGFSPDQVYLILDYETYSEAELKTMGAYEYARHPSTEIICTSWRLGTRTDLRHQMESGIQARAWIPDSLGRQPDFPELFRSLMHPNIVIVAHNAFFEQVITRFVFGEKLMYSERQTLANIPHSRWICTASLAATLAVPRGLEGAANSLELDIKKDMEGAKLLKKMMKPAKPTKKNTDPRRFRDDPENIKRLVEYCRADVDAETLLFLKAPPLIKSERDLWILDQEINMRGFRVDRPLIKQIRKLIRIETENLDLEASELTDGLVTSARERDSVLTWLDGRGLYLPNLQKKTVEDALASDLSGVKSKAAREDVRRMLELRDAVSKSSTAKYPVMLRSSRSDGRVRDSMKFHAASTGRWGGGLVNPQNFKRPHMKTKAILAMIEEIERAPDGVLDWIRMIDANPMSVFGSMLRSMIIPAKGKILHAADFNAIEVRVLFWLAGHQKGLEDFRNARPIYEELAAKIFGIPVEEVTEDQRFVGKTAELGCGYGMGAAKFQGTCKDQGGQIISLKLSSKAVQTYRTENRPVVEYWYALERAAIAAVDSPGKSFRVGAVEWFCWKEFLCCRLPSGRILYYLKPKIGFDRTPWDDKKPTLYYLGVDKTKKKMALEKTYGGKLAENICQAVSRDVMANSMTALQRSGIWDVILTVHDEIISETGVFDSAPVEDYVKVMEKPPVWGADIPLLVKGYDAKRYRK